jgi:surface antigen
MIGAVRKLTLIGVLAIGAAACASEGDYQASDTTPTVGSINTPDKPLQCVPYARQVSNVKLWGDAYTWWDQAAGKFERGAMPKQGAVMVLNGYAGANRAHLAVVREVVSEREIKVDHANWLDDGAIYVDDPVVDVSPTNDWTQVRVWNIRASAWGRRVYPVQGFIGPDPDTDSPQEPVYDGHQAISMN